MAKKSLFMLFPKRVDRAFELQAEQNGHDEHIEYEREELDPKDIEDEVQLADKMEKGDLKSHSDRCGTGDADPLGTGYPGAAVSAGLQATHILNYSGHDLSGDCFL